MLAFVCCQLDVQILLTEHNRYYLYVQLPGVNFFFYLEKIDTISLFTAYNKFIPQTDFNLPYCPNTRDMCDKMDTFIYGILSGTRL